MRPSDLLRAGLFALALPIACAPVITGGSGSGGGGAPATTGGGSVVCTPGASQPCACPAGATGEQACDASGAGWLECQCPTEVCTPLSTISCYEGPPGTEGVGRCVAGTRACAADGSGYGPCARQTLPRQEICGTTTDDDCDGAVLPCADVNAWAKAWSYQGASIIPQGLAREPSSGDILFLTQGYSADTNLAVVRLDPWGNQLGAIEIGFDVALNVIASAPGGGFVLVGHENSLAKELVVRRYDAFGEMMFERTFPGDHVFPRTAAVDASGNIIISGQYNGTLHFGPSITVGPADFVVLSAYVAKLDPLGNPLWAKQVIQGANGEHDWITSVSTDAAGNVVLVGVGSPNAVFDLGAGPVPSAGGHADVFVGKLDPTGAPLWARRLGDDIMVDHVWGEADALGFVILAGNAPWGIDFGGGLIGEEGSYVAALDPAGNHLWSFGAGDVYVNDFAVDPSGNVLVYGSLWAAPVGSTSDMDPWGWDILLSRFAPTGALLSQQRFGDAAVQEGYHLVLDDAGAPYVTGFVCGTVDIGSGPLASKAPNDCDSLVGRPAPP